MGTLTALVFSLATPIFGFALSPPGVVARPKSHAPAAQVQASVAADAPGASGADSASAATGPGPSQDDYVPQLRKRAKLAKIHRTLGITTWAATGVATIAGTIQYRNLYGAPFGADRDHNPCVEGRAFPKQDQCSGTPWFHAITGFAAGGLYFSTLSLALAMPDPDHAAVGDSKFSKTLRLHKTLRWVHLTGMLAQMVLGVIVANPGLTGLDRANDYDTLKRLAGIHLATGYVTLGALSYAGTIMLL